MTLLIAQVCEQEFTATGFSQRELRARVNGADVVERQRRLRHFENVSITWSRTLHPECLVNREIGDVHSDMSDQGNSSISASAKIFIPRASGWLIEFSMSVLYGIPCRHSRP